MGFVLIPWFRKHRPLPTARLPDRGEPIRHTFGSRLAVAQAALARFFAPDDARAADTLARLAGFCQRVPDAAGGRLLWEAGLAASLAALERYPTPRGPVVLTGSDWRYLVLTRVLLDQIEASFAVWRVALFDDKGQWLGDWAPTTGPMTAVDGARCYRVYRLRGGRRGFSEPVTISGLGSVLAAYLLPPTGLAIVMDAARQGVAWSDSARFWQFGDVATGMVKKPYPSTAALSVNVTTGTRARTVGSHRFASSPADADAAPVRSPAPASRSSPLATSLKAAFQVALRDYVESLLQRGALNHVQGSGWVFQDALYLVGKEAATALRRHSANAVLYRVLLGCQLTERHDDKPVWNITVMEAGESRKAATLKFLLTTIWPPAADRITPFAGVICWPGQAATGRTASPAKTSGFESRSGGDDMLGYSTLFDE